MCCARSVARKVLCALCATHCAVRWAREPEASVRRRWAGESAASRLAGRCGCVVCARVMSRRRVMLRIGRRAKRMAHNVRRAWCAAHRAGRSARGPEASARRRRAEGPAASRRVGASWCACVWVGAACEAWGAPVAHCALRWARELEASAGRQGLGAHCAAACGAFRLRVCACEEQTARNVAVRSVASGRRTMCGARGALRAVRCGWREGRK